MSLLRRLPLVLLSVAVLATGCSELADQLTNLPKLKRKQLRFTLAQSSKVYDADGNLIRSIHAVENRTIIPLQRIPDHVVDAVISIEDERFWEHDGVDVRAILRALLANAASGEIREGGSTITQQLVKNVIIAKGGIAERTLERKITEAALSRQLEKKLTKKEILESYLNTVYFGRGAYGVQEAAKTYFGKPAHALALHEAAFLAGVIQSPEDYDPFDHPKRAKDRRNIVLGKMGQLGYASAPDVEAARNKKLKLAPASSITEYPAPYFMDYVERLIKYDPRFDALGETRGERQTALLNGGLRIYTTVDMDMQRAAEEAALTALPNATDPHAALVAIDPRDGHVKAMVGGRNWFAPKKEDPFAKLNLAIQAEPGLGCLDRNKCKELAAPGTGRHAGSAFKAFALVAAIENGVSLNQTYKAGSSITFPGANNGADYVVQNYESSDFGANLSLLDATVFSVNVVYAQVMDEVGPPVVAETAHEMGIRTPFCDTCLSAVLGAAEVNPLDMASAYGTLATNGEHVPPVAITRIEAADGEVIYEDSTKGEQVIEPQAAYLATTALQQVIQRGTAAAYGNIGRPAAGKTGTAQEYRDAWFVGYTPNLVTSVWVGYPEAQIEMKTSCSGSTQPCRPTRHPTGGQGITGGSWPTYIWGNFMRAALAGIEVLDFTQPSGGFVTVAIDTRESGCLASSSTPGEFRVSATFIAGTEPTKTCKIKGESIEVPSVIGFSVDEAIDEIESLGLSVSVQDRETTGFPPGTVVDQSPGGGDSAPQGSTVTIFVAVREGEGEGEVDEGMASVPNVVGYTEAAAEAKLQNAGFDVEVVREAESDRGEARRNRGRVWKQFPSSGSRAEKGSTVTIWVNP